MTDTGWIKAAAPCLATGLALYVTRGLVDRVDAGAGFVRLALLPSWPALAVAIAAGTLIAWSLARLGGRAGAAAPLGALAVLVLPFVPVLPDRWPVLQALAGPMRGAVWLSVAALAAWSVWQARPGLARVLDRQPRARLAAGVFAATAVVSGVTAARLGGTPVFPGGDEPHYLVIAQSLWRDGDLRIENNHQRGDYFEYFHRPLEPHFLTRGRDGEIYSVHPVGLPVVLAPIYAAGGYWGVVCALVAMAAAAATVAWWWAMGALGTGAATFAWAAVAFTAPFLFNTFAVYPEIAAALAVVVATTLSAGLGPAASARRFFAVGLACAALPWLSTKYAPMSAVLVAVALARVSFDPVTVLRRGTAWWVALPYAASLAAWFAFFQVYWGSPWPQAPYGALTQTTPFNLVFGAPGLIFDQEYGLLAYAPAHAMAATGLWAMWRQGGAARRQAVEIALVFAALVGTVGAFRIWWGGTAAPARPIASGLLLLSVPIAAAFREAAPGSARRAGQHLLLWVGIGAAATLAVSQEGLLINQGRDGTSALLEWWSPLWEAWTLAPTFIGHEAPTALLHSAWWLAVAGVAGAVLARWRSKSAGGAALTALAVFAAALATIAVTVPWLPADPPLPAVNLGARFRLAALDGFDAGRLPTGVVFDPLRRVPAGEVVSWLKLGVSPGLRSEPAPLRVIHNGRFALPAGRYDIAVDFGDEVPADAQALAVQVGRIEPALETSTVRPEPGERWHAPLWLPVDAGFVGLRGSLALERAITAITIVPTAIVDASRRPAVPPVLSSARYGDVLVFLHDEDLYPERTGWWVLGRRTYVVTVAVPPGRAAPVTLVAHGGPRPNQATFSTRGWRRQVAFEPGRPQAITLPPVTEGVVSVTVSTENGFRPSEVEPSSRDARLLGLWMEVAKEP